MFCTIFYDWPCNFYFRESIEDVSPTVSSAKRAKTGSDDLDEAEELEINPIADEIFETFPATSASPSRFNTYIPISMLFIGN